MPSSPASTPPPVARVPVADMSDPLPIVPAGPTDAGDAGSFHASEDDSPRPLPPRAAVAASRGRYVIHTWGCQMNVHDSERMAGQLEALGFGLASSDEEADVILLNTC